MLFGPLNDLRYNDRRVIHLHSAKQHLHRSRYLTDNAVYFYCAQSDKLANDPARCQTWREKQNTATLASLNQKSINASGPACRRPTRKGRGLSELNIYIYIYLFCFVIATIRGSML